MAGGWVPFSPSWHDSSHLETLAGIDAIDAEGVELGRVDTTAVPIGVQGFGVHTDGGSNHVCA